MPPGLNVTNSNDVGVSGSGTTGVVGTGNPGDTSRPGGEGLGVFGSGSIGVIGHGEGIGVLGDGNDGPGVFGGSTDVGVSGLGVTGVAGAGTTVGVHGSSPLTGVMGFSQGATGVHGAGAHFGVIGEGIAPRAAGVIGIAGPPEGSITSAAIIADADTNGALIGLVAHCANGFAVLSKGDCLIQADFVATGFKAAAVNAGKGDHRALYCMESPECWFEDFGRARLVRGTARVRLDRTFARVVRTGDYHVFLSPEGFCDGLCVSRRSRNGFEVRELRQGKSTIQFSYRIVARRKDVDAPRFKRVKLPGPLTLPRRPRAKPVDTVKLSEIPKSMRTPQLEALLSRGRSGKGRRRSPRRR